MKEKSDNLIGGLGLTGLALLDYLTAHSEGCIGFDERPESEFGKALAPFLEKGVPFYFGSLPSKVFDSVKRCFVSPGVPPTRPWIQEAKKKGIPVTGELEFASQLVSGSILAVTGTNGKSTTVSLLQAILTAGGISSSLKGNIGSPLVTAVAEPPTVAYVVEVSSYQLETIDRFHPRVAVVLNVTADHLDRYPNMESYAAAKERITQNQTKDDFFIFNADDLYCLKMAERSRAKLLPFSLVSLQKEGGFVEGDDLVVRFGGREDRHSLSKASLAGLHNQENMLAAILAATAVNASSRAIAETLGVFPSLPHRMEKVGTYRGITFFDDSKGTNVGSVVMSLASFDENVILILGGRDKGGDYSPLKPLIKGKAKAVIVLGEAAPKITAALSGAKPLHQAGNMEEAVKKSFEVGQKGDVVLLSPACSSFDQYKNYAERGDDFRKWVKNYGA